MFDPPNMGETPGKMYALAIVLTLLAVLAVLLRLHARKLKNAILAWDDYFIFGALVGHAPRFKKVLSRDECVDKVDTAIHDWYRIVYAHWSVPELKDSSGFALITICRNCTWGSRTAH